MADRRDRGCAGARHSRVRRAVRESNRPALAGATRGGFGPAAGAEPPAPGAEMQKNPPLMLAVRLRTARHCPLYCPKTDMLGPAGRFLVITVRALPEAAHDQLA